MKELETPKKNRIDRRSLSMAPGVCETQVDLNRLRTQRLQKLQTEMAALGYGSLLLTNPVNIRYATGLSVMPIWTAINLARYVLIPVEGEPAVFEYGKSLFKTQEFYPRARAARTWQFRFAQQESVPKAKLWAEEIRSHLLEWRVAGEKIGIDGLDHYGHSALQAAGLRVADADEPLQAARLIKTPDEVEVIKQCVTVAEAAIDEMARAIRPGITENELLGTFWHRMIALGGEHCSTRLLTSGYKTNPWFYESGAKLVRPGDLVGIDTDMIGPEGYLCDISRTFLCGDRPNAVQKEAYRVAYDFVNEMIEHCQVGTSYAELRERHPAVPEAYHSQSYPCMIHGTGCDDEPPFISYSYDGEGVVPRGELRENMVLSVEFYAGKVGEQDGVKLEEQILITAGGPVRLSTYPFEERLLAP